MRSGVMLLVMVLWAIDGSAAEPRSRRLADQWQRADANGDARLSRAEATAMPRLARAFDEIDRDGDGQLNAEEVRAWRKKPARTARKQPGLTELLASADANRDGRLDRSEAEQALPRLARNFDRIDADRDGALSRAEIDAWVARRTAR